MLNSRVGTLDIDRAADNLIEARARDVARFRSLLEEVRGEAAISLSSLSVAVREIALLAERTNGGSL